MQSITLRSHVGPDGILKLQLPVDLKDTELEITVTIRAIAPKLDRKLGVEMGWPEGFFAETAGALADDDSFMRHPQGEYEVRETLELTHNTREFSRVAELQIEDWEAAGEGR